MENRRLLDKITVVCIDDNSQRGIKPLMECIKYLRFGSVKLITTEECFFSNPEISVVQLQQKIGSKNGYSMFVLQELYKYVDTEFCLIVQWDGYIFHAEAWIDEFYNYDYIGAKWIIYNPPFVGNGGFSLRSKKLLEFTAFNKDFVQSVPEDSCICIHNRNYLIANEFNFAPNYIADLFAVENEKYTGQFGWHGGNFPSM